MQDLRETFDKAAGDEPQGKIRSRLRQWPVQLHLLNPRAPYFQNADLLIASDCVAFADANFHQELLDGKALAIGCPKLDDCEPYVDKIAEILKENDIKSVKVAIMEVPCCMGMYMIVQEAMKKSGKQIPIEKTVVSISGETR
jgi:hypothetical protein